ncbi:hypothetical protein D3C76_1822480 [compost metagenome]
MDVEIRQAGDPQARQCRATHALAIAEQDIALGLDLDALAVGAAKHPGLGVSMKTEAEAVMPLQLVKVLRLAATRDVTG